MMYDEQLITIKNKFCYTQSFQSDCLKIKIKFVSNTVNNYKRIKDRLTALTIFIKFNLKN